MAGARLEKIGSIFTRISNLLKTNVIKGADKPLWFDIMKAFPPRIEPTYDRFIDDTPLPEILYEEDKIRAKFYNTFERNEVMDLTKIDKKYSCQRFLDVMKDLKVKDPNLSDDGAFETAANELKLQKIETKPRF